MKVLLIFSSHSHSLADIFTKSLTDLDFDVVLLDPDSLRPNTSLDKKILNKLSSRKRKERMDQLFFSLINTLILQRFNEVAPDLVISYNNSYLLPETVKAMKRSSRFMIYLADNPFYSFYKRYFLQVALEADLVLTPDTWCQHQLRVFGLDNVHFFLLGNDGKIFKRIPVTEKQKQEYGHDILYLGNVHNLESWQWKRAKMLAELLEFDIAIFGNRTWEKILPDFPQLREHFTLLKTPMPSGELNLRMNCSKIYPVDAHPGIIHGVHARLLDAISAGILPVIEYRKDLDLVFREVGPPSFTTYPEARKTIGYYLKHNKEREQLALELNRYVSENLSNERLFKQLINNIL